MIFLHAFLLNLILARVLFFFFNLRSTYKLAVVRPFLFSPLFLQLESIILLIDD